MIPDSARRRIAAAIAIIVVLAMAGLGLLLDAPSEEDRVRTALNDLAAAVELRDPALLEQSLHPDYLGWGADKQSVLDAFREAIKSYESADIRMRGVEVEVSAANEDAEARFEWTYGARFHSPEYGTVDTSALPDRWVPAVARFRQDGQRHWLLLDVETEIPYAEPR